MVPEQDLSTQSSYNIADGGSVEVVQRKSVAGIKPGILNVEPVVLFLVGQNGAELVRKRGS